MSGHGGGGGGGNPALEEDPPEHENHERYLLTYADMITLLLALFIVLFAIGQTDQQKFDEFRAGLASEFGNKAFEGGDGLLTGGQSITTPVTPSAGASSDIRALVEDATTVEETTTSTLPAETTTTVAGAVPGTEGPGDTTTTATTVATGVNPPGTEIGDGDGFAGYGGHIDSSEAGALQEQIEGILEGEGFKIPTDFVVTNDVNRGLVISLKTDSVTFATGSSQLSPEGRRALDALVPALNAVDNDLSVDGFTDDVGDDLSNRKLSSDRAYSAVEYFQVKHNVSSARLAISAWGENKPIAGNDTDLGRRANRRVEIVIRIDGDDLGATTATAPAATTATTATAATAATTGTTTAATPAGSPATNAQTPGTVLPASSADAGATTIGTALPTPSAPATSPGTVTSTATPTTRSSAGRTTGRTTVVAQIGCVTTECTATSQP